jgi:triacylglycerol lipase
MKLTLTQALILTGILTIFLFGTILFYMLRYRLNYAHAKKSITYTWLNTIQCDTEKCDRPIVNLPDIPTQNSNEYSTSVARYCADLVSRVENAVDTGVINDPIGMTLLGYLMDLGESPIFGSVWRQNDSSVIWIAFRGTIDPEEWMQDFDYVQSQFTDDNNDALVHRGFLEVYTNLEPNLVAILENENPSKIIICGHSLGAATSTVTSMKLALQGYDSVVYNFASPRIGNDSFASLASELNIPIFRHVNTTDLIPSMPPSVSPNFTEYTDPYIYTHFGSSYYFTLNWNSLINNHLLGSYIKAFDDGLYQSLK